MEVLAAGIALLVTEICRSVGRFGSVRPDSTTVTAPSARKRHLIAESARLG